MKKLEQGNSNTKEYYNKVFIERFRNTGFDESDAWRIDALLKKYRGGKLLDIGCGVSPLCKQANRYDNAEVYGIDFADEFIKILQEHYPNIHYSVGDFNNLLFEDNFFDYVVLGEVLEHSENPQKLIDEAFRVLKIGGTLALSTPCNETKEMHQYSQHIWGIHPDDIIQMIGKDRMLGIKIISNNIIAYATKS